MFHSNYNVVHIDEVCFYVTSEGTTTNNNNNNMVTEEDFKYHHHGLKSIKKIMFLAALAKPRFDYSRNKMFDGKIGIWPFVQTVNNNNNNTNNTNNTKETSKHPSKERTFIKPIESIRKKEVQDLILNNVIPSIVNKWPRDHHHHHHHHLGDDNGTSRKEEIFIQLDNALPHFNLDDDQQHFLASASIPHFLDIKIVIQPALSPDLNVFDQGFFDSIQSIHDDTTTYNTYDKLIESVQMLSMSTK